MNAAIGLASLRLDGFCSLRAGDNEGWLISRREPFHKPALTINARTDKDGVVAAEILDRRNRVVPGFSRRDCAEFTGDATRHVLKWQTAQLPAVATRADYKLRFWLKNAELFSYQPHDLDR